jgi:hypothetical protein
MGLAQASCRGLDLVFDERVQDGFTHKEEEEEERGLKDEESVL